MIMWPTNYIYSSSLFFQLWIAIGDGKKLADVGLDDDHSICIWDWKKEEKMVSTRGHKDMIFVIEWNPFDPNYLVSVGEKHIKFWTQKGIVNFNQSVTIFLWDEAFTRLTQGSCIAQLTKVHRLVGFV